MEKDDLQRIFTTAFTGLRDQGFKRSTRENRDGGSKITCAYRSDDGGLRCAIGHCIPDDRYGPSLEGRSATAPDVLAALGIVPTVPKDAIYPDISLSDGSAGLS